MHRAPPASAAATRCFLYDEKVQNMSGRQAPRCRSAIAARHDRTADGGKARY
jgi:hypothetical protein